MEIKIRYQGRTATSEDIDFINELIKKNPQDSRRALSKKLCEAWNWRQSNGYLKDMLCRSFMLVLDRAGHIKLPPVKQIRHNPLSNRKKPEKIDIDKTLLQTELSKIQPLDIQLVRWTLKEKIYNSLIEQYHYLGYTYPIGEHLKYIVFAKEKIISCLAFSSAPRHIGSRDKYIGWPPQIRKKNIHLIAYNTRFLILPWIQIKNLASHILGQIARRISKDWEKIYNHPVCYIETFVDTEKFTGACYKAANWVYIGKTTGRGKNDNTQNGFWLSFKKKFQEDFK
jgi:hypothetical protein